MRRNHPNSILLIGGSHHADYYYDRDAALRPGDGVWMRDGDRYIVRVWPTGELVGLAEGLTMDEPAEFADLGEIDISLPENAIQIAQVVMGIGKDIAVDIAKETIKLPLRIGRRLLPF